MPHIKERWIGDLGWLAEVLVPKACACVHGIHKDE
jgi:hypothetical protein